MRIYFHKPFDNVSNKTLIGEFRKCGLNEWTVRWAEDCVDGRAESIVINRVERSWRTAVSGVSQGPILDLV